MHAVILAGGDSEAVSSGKVSKAVVELKGRPMIHYVIDALRSADEVEKIMVIGNVDVLKPLIGDHVDILVEERDSIIDNVLEAINFFKEEEKLLIATADIPLLKGCDVEAFIQAGEKLSVDLLYPIVEKDNCVKYYPDLKRTYVTLRDGTFTGGNLFIIVPKAIQKIERIARLMVQYRKEPLKMCRLLGIIFVIKLLSKKLSIAQLEDHLQKRFNFTGKAYINSSPGICHDIDCLEDIKKIESYL